jgi:uncharacterized protein (DUF2147 family)
MQKFFGLIIFFLLNVAALAQPDNIIGTWLTQEKDAKVEIYKSEDVYCGKIVWLKEPNDPETGKPQLDNENPDEKKRSLPILGSVMLWGFKYDDSEYTGGKVYDAREGDTYKGKMWLENNTLKMRGYAFVFYRTETWTRVN